MKPRAIKRAIGAASLILLCLPGFAAADSGCSSFFDRILDNIANRPISETAYLDQARQRFEAMDRNKDGQLSPDEVEGAQEARAKGEPVAEDPNSLRGWTMGGGSGMGGMIATQPRPHD